MDTTIIHEFDPCVYPRLLWVVKGGTLEGIKERFNVDLDLDDDVGGAVTIPTSRKEDDSLGYIVWFPKAKDIQRLDWIAHESVHVAVNILSEIGSNITREDQEPLAYLVGWTFRSIDTVRRCKYGSNKSQCSDTKEIYSQKSCETSKATCRDGRWRSVLKENA